jgi:hypothetical protein
MFLIFYDINILINILLLLYYYDVDIGRFFIHMFVDIFSIRHFLHQSALCPIQGFVPFGVFSIRPFVPFGVFPFAVLSHSAFCLSSFCRWTFFTFGVCYLNILSVNWYFGHREVGFATPWYTVLTAKSVSREYMEVALFHSEL